MGANQRFETPNHESASAENASLNTDIETLRERAALFIANTTSWILGPVYVATSELKHRATRLLRDISRGF